MDHCLLTHLSKLQICISVLFSFVRLNLIPMDYGNMIYIKNFAIISQRKPYLTTGESRSRLVHRLNPKSQARADDSGLWHCTLLLKGLSITHVTLSRSCVELMLCCLWLWAFSKFCIREVGGNRGKIRVAVKCTGGVAVVTRDWGKWYELDGANQYVVTALM